MRKYSLRTWRRSAHSFKSPPIFLILLFLELSSLRSVSLLIICSSWLNGISQNHHPTIKRSLRALSSGVQLYRSLLFLSKPTAYVTDTIHKFRNRLLKNECPRNTHFRLFSVGAERFELSTSLISPCTERREKPAAGPSASAGLSHALKW